MKLTKRLVLCAAVASSLLTLAGASHAQAALDNIQKTNLIKIAIPTDFPPYGFVGIDLKPQGLDIDMANYIAAKMGVKIELVPVTSAVGPSGYNSWEDMAGFRKQRAVAAVAATYPATSASTRSGLPLPCWIFSGGQISRLPVGGNWSRLHRHCRP